MTPELSFLSMLGAGVGGAVTTLAGVWWLLGPRIDRYVDGRADKKVLPLQEQLNRHEKVFVPLPMTMDALKTSIAQLADAVKEMTDRHQHSEVANAIMRERVNTLFDERRTTARGRE